MRGRLEQSKLGVSQRLTLQRLLGGGTELHPSRGRLDRNSMFARVVLGYVSCVQVDTRGMKTYGVTFLPARRSAMTWKMYLP